MRPNTTAINHLKKDKVLNHIIKTTELNTYSKNKSCFNALVKSITSQQLSVKAAASIYSRLVSLCKNRITKKNLLVLEHDSLRGVGLSNSKAQYVKNVASFFIDEKLTDSKISKLSDEEIIKLLTQIKGVGVWTVQMMLIFHLGRPDVFPIGDLEVRKQMIKMYQVTEEGKKQLVKLEEIASDWSPYRSLASIYLWSYDGQ